MKTLLPSDICILWDLYKPFDPYFKIDIKDIENAIHHKSPLIESFLLRLNIEIHRSRITDLIDQEEKIKYMIQEARLIKAELEERQLFIETPDLDKIEKLISITEDLEARSAKLREIERKRKAAVEELAKACETCEKLTEELLSHPGIMGEPRMERLLNRILENKWEFSKPKLKKETNKLEIATCQIDTYGDNS
jgi:hypothetical protein